MEIESNQNSENYDIINIDQDYHVRQSENFNALFKNDSPVVVLKRENTNIHNRIFDFQPKAKAINFKKDYISIDFVINSKKFKDFSFDDFKVNIGYKNYSFTQKEKNHTAPMVQNF